MLQLKKSFASGTKIWFRSILWACITCGCLQVSAFAQSSLEEGRKWYERRAVKADSFRAHPRYINNAIQAYRDVLQEEESSEEAVTGLLKSYYFKGMYTGLEEDLQKKVYEQGRELGEEMMEQYPQSVPIKFWYSANLGRWAVLNGIVAAARSGVAKKLRRISNEIIDADPEYLGGGGYRILAQVHFNSPSIPLIMSWPSDEKALKLVQQAIGIAPNHPSNRLLYAEILLEFDEDQQAKMHLDYLAGEMEPRSTHLVEDSYVKHQAQEMLREHY